jgi:hypothetical protein
MAKEIRTPAIEVLRYPGTDPRTGEAIPVVEVKKVAVVIRTVKEEAKS